MDSPRYTVDPKKTIPLRFDDDAFVDALADAEGDFKDKLQSTLGVPPDEAVFDSLIANQFVISARAGVYGREADDIGNQSQQDDARKGIKVDVGRANRRMWMTWAVGVECVDGALDDDLVAKLNSRNKVHREEAFGDLESFIADALMARLLVHIRDQRKSVMRDPAQTTARRGKAPQPQTFVSAAGETAPAQSLTTVGHESD